MQWSIYPSGSSEDNQKAIRNPEVGCWLTCGRGWPVPAHPRALSPFAWNPVLPDAEAAETH